MTTYKLPEGMTADRLRDLVECGRSDLCDDCAQLTAWADAIDPPEPVSVVTDEMIGAVADEVGWVGWGDAEDILHAVERLGWLRDPSLLKRDGKDLVAMLNLDDDDLRYIAAENKRLSERLAMAEGLLRKLTPCGEYPIGGAGGGAAWCPAASCYVTHDEAEYLRSLDEEGE